METKESAFKFDYYIVRKSSINIGLEAESDKSLKIKINPSGLVNNDVFKLMLDIQISNDTQTVTIDVLTEALFTFNTEISKNNIENYFCINAPAIVFPYIRAYISTLTALSGTDTLILPTLNLTEMGEVLKKNITGIGD
jgi:preprotein translocase subunit SecB